jgi:PII-like signaling protein
MLEMEKDYRLISLYASESTRAGRRSFHEAVVKAVKESGTGARCVVPRGIMGLGHGGRVFTRKTEILSFDLPIKR